MQLPNFTRVWLLRPIKTLGKKLLGSRYFILSCFFLVFLKCFASALNGALQGFATARRAGFVPGIDEQGPEKFERS